MKQTQPPPPQAKNLNLPLENQPTPQNGHTQIYRHPSYASSSLFSTTDDIFTLTDLLTRNFLYAKSVEPDLQYLGYRDSKTSKEYTWKTYIEIEQLVQNLGSGILANNLDKEEAFSYGDFGGKSCKLIGIFGDNCHEWILADLACILYG